MLEKFGRKMMKKAFPKSKLEWLQLKLVLIFNVSNILENFEIFNAKDHSLTGNCRREVGTALHKYVSLTDQLSINTFELRSEVQVHWSVSTRFDTGHSDEGVNHFFEKFGLIFVVVPSLLSISRKRHVRWIGFVAIIKAFIFHLRTPFRRYSSILIAFEVMVDTHINIKHYSSRISSSFFGPLQFIVYWRIRNIELFQSCTSANMKFWGSLNQFEVTASSSSHQETVHIWSQSIYSAISPGTRKSRVILNSSSHIVKTQQSHQIVFADLIVVGQSGTAQNSAGVQGIRRCPICQRANKRSFLVVLVRSWRVVGSAVVVDWVGLG